MDTLNVSRRVRIPVAEFNWTYSRSGGPGGQNVNKVNSRATLRWNVVQSPSLPADVRERLMTRQRRRISKEGDLLIHSDRYRDQAKNVDDCLERLRLMLAEVAVAPKVRVPTKPTHGSQRRRLVEKKERSETKSRRRPPSMD